MSSSATLLLSVLATSAPLQVVHDVSRDFYPTPVGATWTYESSVRGRFSNTVADSTVEGGHVWYRVTSTDAQGAVQQFAMRHEGGRLFQRVGGAERLFADFTVPVGGTYTVPQGTASLTVRFAAEHDTITLTGSRFRDVREYRTRMPDGGEQVQYYARGIGIVQVAGPSIAMLSRLVAADVGGRTFTAPPDAVPNSGVAARALTERQVADLALLGRVWGFLKYHHPAVTQGGTDWDAALLRVMPEVLEAGSAAAARGAITRWAMALDEAPACAPCAQLPEDLQLQPDNDWTRDGALLGAELRGFLQRTYGNRPAAVAQHYVAHAPGVGNPIFRNEDAHPAMTLPDAGYRLLALFRYWNIIQYWMPYRDLLEDDWHEALHEFIPAFMQADRADAYHLTMLRLIGRVHDTHATLGRAHAVRPPAGPAQLPVVLRFVEGHAVVTAWSHDELGPASGLQRGDAIVRIDGAPVDSLVRAWRPYYPASNEPARLRDIARSLTRGAPGPVRLTLLRDGRTLDVSAERVPSTRLDLNRGRTHDLPGETFQMLGDDVAYMKLSSITIADVPRYMERAAGARVLVVDIRNYPNQFVVYPLGGRLVERPTPFAVFTGAQGANPGAFRWSQGATLTPMAPRFEGRVVVLVDESSISQSEFTAMALRAGPNTIVAGSTTAAADGNISTVPLPGGLETWITGIGVFYPDRTPTQRIGIIPDLEVRPTIAGVRAGRDEVLEAAVSQALGRPFRL